MAQGHAGARASMQWCGRARAAGLLVLMVIAGAAAGAEATLVQLAKPLELVVYRPGTKPPAFSGQPTDARLPALSLAALRGKVVIINFWASWCSDCRPEMRALEELHREFSARGLAVVGVNVREAPETARRYAHELSTSLPLLLDPDGTINALYGVIGVPTSFVVGRDGRAVGFAVGARKWSSPAARALVEALLTEPKPP